jgi:hypothetical protein
MSADWIRTTWLWNTSVKNVERNERVHAMTVECTETQWILRLDGDQNLTSALKLKGLLIEGLASGKDLQVDLEQVQEIDITVLQLLFAAGREASRESRGFVSRVPETVLSAARDAGFESFPGQSPQTF